MRVEKNNKSYRMRRGQLVEIPEKWVGKTLHPQVKRKRQSKQIKKVKRCMQASRNGNLINLKDLKYHLKEDLSEIKMALSGVSR